MRAAIEASARLDRQYCLNHDVFGLHTGNIGGLAAEACSEVPDKGQVRRSKPKRPSHSYTSGSRASLVEGAATYVSADSWAFSLEKIRLLPIRHASAPCTGHAAVPGCTTCL